MNATTTSSRTPTVEAANVVERWVYLGVRESGKSTEAKPVTLHAWKRPNGDVAFWGKHGPKGAHSPSVGQCFYFDVKTTGQPDGSDGITVWFGTRAFAGNDHGLDDETLQEARAKDLAWRRRREALKVAKRGCKDEALEEALDLLANYYWADHNRRNRAAVLGWFIQRITGGAR